MHWVTIDYDIMTAAAEIAGEGVICLFVAPQPEGTWDWRVWNTAKSQFHRSGLEPTVADALVAAEYAAAELSVLPAAEAPSATDKAAELARDNESPLHDGRTFDKVLRAFHMACDEADLDVATPLLRILDTLATRRMVQESRRVRIVERLVAAHARRWQLVDAASQ